VDKCYRPEATCKRDSSAFNRTRTGTNSNNNCFALKERFRQVDFAITETVLYLDAYPECKKALEYYHRLIDEREQLKTAINNQCGPVTHFDNISTESWSWISSPWPWKYEAN